MKIKKKKAVASKHEPFELPLERSEPESDLWKYAYLISGYKKIGKTSFAIEGADEFVIQFDKPQISYALRETCPADWKAFEKVLKALELAAKNYEFPYNRVIIDGVGEWFSMCQAEACKKFGVEHPADAPYGKAWHELRDMFNDAVNRLMRLQVTAECGLMFIAHAEWKEVTTRDSGKIERLTPIMPARCEDIVGGKVDGWFMYDYVGDSRVLVIQGDETIAAGHRIDGRFLTKDGRRVREIPMGGSAKEALENFKKAFDNELEYATYKEARDAKKRERVTGGDKPRRKIKVKK